MPDHLYYGDNLSIMEKMPKDAVDLIYLDPPFNSKKNYNMIYKNLTGKPVPDQADAFCDTWEMDPQKEQIAKAMPMLMREHGVEDYYVEFWRLWINALRHTQPHLLAYLVYMVQRMLHMKSILRKTGSIWLHCDPTASHYIKIMMDGIFGHKNFRNEIIWKRTTAHSDGKRAGRIHDVILFYSASDKYTWNKVYQPYDAEYVDKYYRYKDEDGARWASGDVAAAGVGQARFFNGVLRDPPPGSHWRYSQEKIDEHVASGRIYFTKNGFPRFKRYLKDMEGVVLQDIWDDKDVQPVVSWSDEGLGYPTQKPTALLERIIRAASDPGDVVFDPFCGCGTTIYVAVKNDRRWIGCDIAILSIKLMREILASKYKLTEGVQFDVNGIPVSVEQAQELFKRDPFQFEHWVVERIGGFPTKKTGDKGIDGRMYFETRGGLKAMVLSVKGGKLRPTDVRDLRGVLADEPETEMAGFLSIQEPSKAMREAASLAGQYEYAGVLYDRIQFLTVKEILEEKREFHTPTKMGSKLATGQQSFLYEEA
jgi:DNA modification methylase